MKIAFLNGGLAKYKERVVGTVMFSFGEIGTIRKGRLPRHFGFREEIPVPFPAYRRPFPERPRLIFCIKDGRPPRRFPECSGIRLHHFL